MAVCNQCGAPLDPNSATCRYCGEPAAYRSVPQQMPPQQMMPQQMMPQQPMMYQRPPMMQQPVYMGMPGMLPPDVNPAWPIKSKVTAGVLGIFLGGLGIHKFYLGKSGLGILYLIFCWTYIPEILGLIEGITYLTSSDHEFMVKNQVRIR